MWKLRAISDSVPLLINQLAEHLKVLAPFKSHVLRPRREQAWQAQVQESIDAA